MEIDDLKIGADNSLAMEMFDNLLSFLNSTRGKHDDINLPPNAMGILHYIIKNSKCGKKGVNPSNISDETGYSRPFVTSMLNILETEGYIKRNISSEDRRKFEIYVTDMGKSFLKEHFQKHYGQMNQLVLQLGQEDSEEFIRILKRASKILSQNKINATKSCEENLTEKRDINDKTI